MAKKPSLGRQKIAIAKIPKKNHLQVTFSKRRSGLFKKASELCTLCGVEIAILVFSPANKAFSFGHPEVDSVLDRFLARDGCGTAPDSGTRQLFEAHRSASIRELNSVLTHVTGQLEAEKKRGEELDKASNGQSGRFWWESPVDEIDSLEELEQLKSSLEELKRTVVDQTARLMLDTAGLVPPYLGPDCNLRNGAGDEFERKPDLDRVSSSAATLAQYFGFPQENGSFLAY